MRQQVEVGRRGERVLDVGIGAGEAGEREREKGRSSCVFM